jgi:uncharacterized protein (DUF2336 family)
MELDGFFFWIAEATPERRIAAAERLADAFVAADLDEAKRESVEVALTHVAHDPDPAVRRRLAEVLSAVRGAPGHLIETLLADEPETAAIVAGQSLDLIDAELAALVGWADPLVREAVADRPSVGPSVAAALAASADRAAVVRLLGNPGAVLPVEALEKIVERFGDWADVRELLMFRPDVPIAIRHRVLEKLAEAIGRHVVGDGVDEERLAEATRDARDRATVALSARAEPGEAAALVEHLRSTGQLTTRLVLRAACVGDLRFVEAALACLVGLPGSRVAALLGEGRRSALAALHRRAGMPERAFPAFAAAIEEHRRLMRETGGWDGLPGDRARFARRLVERVLTRVRDRDIELGDDLLLLLRRFAADAARDHMRAVTAARTAPLLPAPSVDVPDAAAAEAGGEPVATHEISVADFEAEIYAAEVFANRPAEAAETPEVAAAPVTDASAQEIPTVPAIAAEETAPLPGVAEEVGFDEPAVGLFDHARPEDFPPEWLEPPKGRIDLPGFMLRAA